MIKTNKASSENKMNRKTVFLQFIMVLTSRPLLRFKVTGYAIGRWRRELLGISFGSSSLLLLMKVTGVMFKVKVNKMQKRMRPGSHLEQA